LRFWFLAWLHQPKPAIIVIVTAVMIMDTIIIAIMGIAAIIIAITDLHGLTADILCMVPATAAVVDLWCGFLVLDTSLEAPTTIVIDSL